VNGLQVSDTGVAAGMLGSPATQQQQKPGLDMTDLMRELDSLYNRYNSANAFSKVPIYAVQREEMPTSPANLAFPWWKPVSTLAGMLDYSRRGQSAITFNPTWAGPNINSIRWGYSNIANL